MEELRKLTDQEIHQRMVDTSQRERELTAQILSLVEEAGRRKFYLDFGYGTLFDYLTLGLKYSPTAAMRRLSSARIAREIPEVKERVLDGRLSLSSLSQAEQFFRNEEKNNHRLNTEEKKDVLRQIEGQSTRQAQKTLIQLSSAPEALQNKDKIKAVSAELSQISFTADEEFMKQLEEARGLLAHRLPHATISEVITEVMKVGIEGLRKQKFKLINKNRDKNKDKKEEQVQVNSKAQAKDRVQNASNANAETTENQPVSSGAGNNTSSYIPAEVCRQVYERDQGRCVVLNPLTGKRCGSQRALELDHYPTPKAMGGASTVSNLRVACRSCNLLHAAHRYGREKIVGKMNRNA